MTKITKKLQNLQSLKFSVLGSVKDDCEKIYNDQNRFSGWCEIMHNAISIGTVNYSVSVDTLKPQIDENYHYPAEIGEYEFILEKCVVDMIYNSQDCELVKRTNALNHLLLSSINKILNY